MNRLSIIARPLVRSGHHTLRSCIPVPARFISNTSRLGSLFGGITKNENDTAAQEVAEPSDEDEKPKKVMTPQNDPDLIAFYEKKAKGKAVRVDKFVHPLKVALYNKNVEQNGFFKNHQVVEHEGKKYKLSLTPTEIDILEPSIYLQSYRIKSSMKKATIVNRMVRKFNVNLAINQLHFNPKKMATELEKLLKRGLEEAKLLNLNGSELYIDQLWTGSDGKWRKRLDIKGRGRHGILHHRYVHLKCILKTKQTLDRLDWEKNQKELHSKPRTILINDPLNFKVRGWYKW
jgi:ribosomal protein L22